MRRLDDCWRWWRGRPRALSPANRGVRPLRSRARAWGLRWAPMTSPAMMRSPVCARAFRGRSFPVCGRKARQDGRLASMAPFPSRISFMPWPRAAKRPVKTMLYDAMIIGAGPAGSAAAQLLAQAGWSVALIEKAQFPRRKVCGEFISATTMPVLQSCGITASFIAAAGPPVTRVGIYAGNAMLRAPREQVWGRALGREHLDVMLRDAAVTAGVDLFQPAEVANL